MAKKMDWRRAQLLSKPSLDFRYELDVRSRDRASRWIAAVERRQLSRSSSYSSRSSSAWITATSTSSSAVPW
jgi:hypothetical protein